MASADEFVDSWVAHATKTGASTPELMVLMLLGLEKAGEDRTAITASALATAIQRLVTLEQGDGEP